ncbi:MAG TPA: Crp/Fnr family transcriptional regulator [Chitinispirillaceae bacterium]|nr:Crp/Fnr family transcriptional regulator [Chitinispirillaceae bacterium]
MKRNDSSKLNTRFLAKDEFLFRQNDNSHDLYIVNRGCVRIIKNEGSQQIELDIASSGMVIGEIASIDGGCRSASAVAVEDTEFSVITASEFASILEKIPEYLRKIALILVHRLREVDERITRSIEGDCTNHIAGLISLIASTEWSTKSSDGIQINRKFLENELMDLLNISPQEISSKLDWFEKKQLLHTEHGNVFIRAEEIESLAKSMFEGSTELPVI